VRRDWSSAVSKSKLDIDVFLSILFLDERKNNVLYALRGQKYTVDGFVSKKMSLSLV